MLSLDDLWERLTSFDETVEIEAKTLEQSVGSSVLETICAFANEPGRGGGYLLLGVALDETGLFATHRVVGVKDTEKVQAELATKCRTLFNVTIRPEMVVEERDGKRVIVLHILEAPAGDKPVFIESKGLPKGAFRRIGSTDQHCTDDDLAVFY